MGHSSIKVTLEIYTHLSGQEKTQEKIEKIAL
jgi:hypothetical protein